MKRIKVKAELCAKDDRYGLDYPVTCRQCTDCPPIHACPEQALSRTEEGLTWCSWQDCTGCGVCENVCTYGAIKVNDKALICNLCGGAPQCVARCPTAAIEYVEMPPSTETPIEAFSRLKEEWGFE